MDSNEKRILIFTSAAHFLTHFFMLFFPAIVMPISRDLGLSFNRVISISFPMYLCYGILAIPWGLLSDRIGPRLIMGLGMLIAGAGFIAAGLVQSVFLLTLFLGIIGVGCSAYHPSGLALISKGIRVRGRAMGINGLCGVFGIASAPLAAGILSYLSGWKNALIFMGFIGIIIGLCCIFVPFSVAREQDLQKGTSVDKGQAVRLFLILCGGLLFSGLMYRGFTVIFPTFLENKLTGILTGLNTEVMQIINLGILTPEKSTLIATIVATGVYLIGMLGQLLGGKIADRYDLRWGYLLFFICALPFLISLNIFENFMLLISAGFFGFFAFGMQPIENSLIAMVTPPQWRSVSYGIKFTIVFGAGSLSVYLVSLVQSEFSLDMVIMLLSLFLVIVILFIIGAIIISRGATIRHHH